MYLKSLEVEYSIFASDQPLLWDCHLDELSLSFLINKGDLKKKNVLPASQEFYGNQEIMCLGVLCKLKTTNQILETVALILTLIFSAFATSLALPSFRCSRRCSLDRR